MAEDHSGRQELWKQLGKQTLCSSTKASLASNCGASGFVPRPQVGQRCPEHLRRAGVPIAADIIW